MTKVAHIPRTTVDAEKVRLERVHHVDGDKVYRVCTGGLFDGQRVFGYVQGRDGRWFVRRSMTAPVEVTRSCEQLREAVELCVALWPAVPPAELYAFRNKRRPRRLAVAA